MKSSFSLFQNKSKKGTKKHIKIQQFIPKVNTLPVGFGAWLTTKVQDHCSCSCQDANKGNSDIHGKACLKKKKTTTIKTLAFCST